MLGMIKYGKRLYFKNPFKFRKGFLCLGMTENLAKDLRRRGLTN